MVQFVINGYHGTWPKISIFEATVPWIVQAPVARVAANVPLSVAGCEARGCEAVCVRSTPGAGARGYPG